MICSTVLHRPSAVSSDIFGWLGQKRLFSLVSVEAAVRYCSFLLMSRHQSVVQKIVILRKLGGVYVRPRPKPPVIFFTQAESDGDA